ncbi:LLM class flavin-dependent oxidoreductase [Acetobacter oeni]|uniref:Monooxygenase n=1 Tax=Acetobacter oeni TaxID=304077 RepID=A0A511XKN4_9PROT|nr:LLM class flavin-dependent oxidoreductase [Acetobacter oeni]MBB3883743.1 FMN-dependent oxidoreductase (nitrilotriacetate monooxygenase family) [Acetobacter oeni]NHO19909.1 NtaA/DmoA family FMN-dependent monooxygenase [Acetobacter oeni]GBR10260.1 monooxygenase [Acetobacter oeni LMG 21952]GEN63499.1 monooxygenase [Acetobacter oeni]
MAELRLNAFDMNCVSHQASGLWRHPRDRSADYRKLGYWTSLARLLEKGLFDGLFLADVLGVYDVYGSNPDAALRNAAQVPVNDPAMLISAMASVTSDLCFGLTSTLSYEPPYPFARRMSTLDHLTEGRIGWNIVTGYLDSAARGTGRQKQASHDIRYDVADEYLHLVYRLWEESWSDAAVLRDRERGVFTDPDHVRRIRHEGEYFKLNAIHLSEPSLQRTPVLYQAGSSARGCDFAARHAECVFVAGPSATVVAESVANIRARSRAAGRLPEQPLIFSLLTIITGPDDEAAQAKWRDYRRYVSLEGALTLLSGWTGIDFSRYSPDDPVRHIRNDAIHSAVDALTVQDPGRVWTVGELAEHAAIGGMGNTIIGGPERIADLLEEWVVQTGVDGFNLAYAVAPETFTDVVELIVPVLQRRGIYKLEYRPGTLRDKLFARGDRLGADHPGGRVSLAASGL